MVSAIRSNTVYVKAVQQKNKVNLSSKNPTLNMEELIEWSVTVQFEQIHSCLKNSRITER